MIFSDTPFADRFFAQLVRDHGCHDEGRSWHAQGTSPKDKNGNGSVWERAGSRGMGNEDVRGVPEGLPVFRYGHDKGVAFLSVSLPQASYVRRGDDRSIHLAMEFPETVIMAAVGRPLREFVTAPGIADDVIAAITVDKDSIRLQLAPEMP